MTDPLPNLNLIQRAMQLDTGPHIDMGKSAFVETTFAEPRSTDNGEGAPDLDLSLLKGNATPVRERSVTSLQIEFNPARCREEKILVPGNPEIETLNEFRIIKRRLLQTMKQASPEIDYPPAVLVTSARPGEGKTFVSLNLALTLADERDFQVLLMEGDVVNPSLCRYFATGRVREGLTELLNEKISSPEDVVYQCENHPNLHVMFAGNPDPRASELMASPRMPEILAQLHRSYRNLLVVVDCSPVVSPEPAALAGHVAHTIVVVGAEQASRAEIEDALAHVSPSRQISLVFNKSPRWRKMGSYYHYGYGYGYGAAAHAAAEASKLDVGAG
jgi:protein-tyrosine kinase